MSAPLPHFVKGHALLAADLNALAGRVRELQARAEASGEVGSRARRVIPCRHYAFELGTLSGIIYYRQGWIDPGTGEPQAVGEKEWNPLGCLKPCSVWLEFTGSSPETCAAEVVMGEYDETTPETNMRRRLGYVREQKAEEEGQASTWYCVQLCGGLITPCAPRRVMGSPSLVEPEKFCKYDHSWTRRYAGAVYGGGQYHEAMRAEVVSRVSFGYSMCAQPRFYAPRGHRQMAQGLVFSTAN